MKFPDKFLELECSAAQQKPSANFLTDPLYSATKFSSGGQNRAHFHGTALHLKVR